MRPSPHFYTLMSRWFSDYKEQRTLLNQVKKNFTKMKNCILTKE